jgi:hypothetical protein
VDRPNISIKVARHCGSDDMRRILVNYIDFLEASLLAWYNNSNGSTKQSTWPGALWVIAREIELEHSINQENEMK